MDEELDLARCSLQVARFGAYPTRVVDGDVQRRGRGVAFRCLDPGRHDGETESIGPDRRVRVREFLKDIR
jgi:hypothetical protein